MNKLKIFIATPISSFSNNKEYLNFRYIIMNLVSELRKDFCVYSEIEEFVKMNSFDEPAKAISKDFDNILISDFFILIHPSKMQTSTLIELGYAFAHKKNIIIISSKNDLPYLALGMSEIIDNVFFLECADINNDIVDKIPKIIKNW